jgi:molecular chaperone DnaK
LVFDWGGGTLDITLVRLESGTISEISSQGAFGKSGDHFDEVLSKDVINSFLLQNRIDPSGFRLESGIKSILSSDVEGAKIDLSRKNDVSVEVPGFCSFNGKSYHLESEITRKRFESLIDTCVQDSMNLVEQVLRKSRVQASQVDRVLLIGGTSQVPLVDCMMRDTFGITKVQRVANADTVIAEGAAIISYNNWQPYLVRPICAQLSTEAHYEIFEKGTSLDPKYAQREINFFCTDNRWGEGILALTEKFDENRHEIKEPIIQIPISRTLNDVYKEKVVVKLGVDENAVLIVKAQGSIKGQEVYEEFNDLCYGLKFA